MCCFHIPQASSAALMFLPLRSAGISQRLFEFLESMLLVILFAPSVALSAAASLDALYFFALAHQQDFDVR
eukprot:78833-Pelagomonas_calceolata.AAC.2